MSAISALLLVGSPKGERSSSNIIGSYLMKRLESAGAWVETIHAVQLVDGMGDLTELTAVIDAANVVVIAAPLYIDCIPAPMIRVLERLRDARKSRPPQKTQRLFVIVNSGFPEPRQSRTALDIYRIFAREAGIEWAGGIAVGMGSAIGDISLESAGGLARNLREGLNVVAAALTEGKPIPEEAIVLASKPFMLLPLAQLMLIWFGKRMWNSQVHDKKVLAHMRDKPYI